jgi:proteasome lid subunit RPN8/RPN11
VEKVYLLSNPDQSPEHFSIDPCEQLAAVKDIRKNGLSPLGNFHSHPASPARPSAEDIRLAYDSSAVYLILSLAGPAPVLKAFSVQNGQAAEVPIGSSFDS